jgi:hypothetical protein
MICSSFFFGGQVMMKYLAMECVARELEEIAVPLKNIPGASRKNMFLCPWMLDFSETGKFDGLGRYPSTLQFRAHFPSIVNSNYQSEKEALEVKFTKVNSQTSTVEPFSIGYVDGQNKGLIVQSIFALLELAEGALVSFFFAHRFQNMAKRPIQKHSKKYSFIQSFLKLGIPSNHPK